MDARARQLIEIGDSLFSKREVWISLNQDIAEQFYSLRADFTTTFDPGRVMSENQMESTPEQNRRDLANFLAMTRMNHKIRTNREEIDELPDVAKWLDDKAEVHRRALRDPRSQFTRAMKGADNDWVTFGGAIISVEEGPTRDHLLFRNHHWRDCAIMEDECGKVDVLHRKMKMTARGMVQRWKDKCHQTVKDAAEKTPTLEFDVRHIVMPSDEFRDGKRTGGLPYASLYVDVTNDEILSEGYLPNFMYAVSRWFLVSSFPYPFSPVTYIALPDGRGLQQLARIITEQGEKAVDPPMAAVGDALRSDLNLYAGGVTSIAADYDEKTGEAIRQLQTVGNLQFGVEMKLDARASLASSFYLNKLFLPTNGPEMSATESNLRNQEFIRVATPLFEPFDEEMNARVFDLSFGILLNTPAIKAEDMPDELSQKAVQFIFDNPVKQAEGRAKLGAAQETFQLVGLANALDPTVIHDYDVGQIAKDAVRGTGAPADWMVDEEEAKAGKQQAIDQQQATQAAMALKTGAGVAGDVANATTALTNAGLT